MAFSIGWSSRVFCLRYSAKGEQPIEEFKILRYSDEIAEFFCLIERGFEWQR